MEERVCLRCKGEGTVFRKGFTSLGGKVYPDQTDVCTGCEGRKTFAMFDKEAILVTITTTRGAVGGQRNLRKAWAGREHFRDHEVARQYYCWRLARFHGGVDMTMPMTAGLVMRADPFKPELDKLADEVAKTFLGTDLAGAARWGRAFGII